MPERSVIEECFLSLHTLYRCRFVAYCISINDNPPALSFLLFRSCCSYQSFVRFRFVYSVFLSVVGCIWCLWSFIRFVHRQFELAELIFVFGFCRAPGIYIYIMHVRCSNSLRHFCVYSEWLSIRTT